MSIIGDTVRLKGEFKTWAGTFSNPTGMSLKIYDSGRNVLTTIGSTSITEHATGRFYYDYAIPTDSPQPIFFEYSGTLEGSTATARGVIHPKWV